MGFARDQDIVEHSSELGTSMFTSPQGFPTLDLQTMEPPEWPTFTSPLSTTSQNLVNNGFGSPMLEMNDFLRQGNSIASFQTASSPIARGCAPPAHGFSAFANDPVYPHHAALLDPQCHHKETPGFPQPTPVSNIQELGHLKYATDFGKNENKNDLDEAPLAIDKPLACPFWKVNPQQHPKCSNFKAHQINRVKQHIKRTHNQAPSPKTRPDPRGINKEQANKLRRRSSAKLSPEKQWEQVFHIVCPGQELPISPYNNFDQMLTQVYMAANMSSS